jgi:hypothetical protein
MFWKKREDRRLFDAWFVGSPLRGVDVDIEECMPAASCCTCSMTTRHTSCARRGAPTRGLS